MLITLRVYIYIYINTYGTAHVQVYNRTRVLTWDWKHL